MTTLAVFFAPHIIVRVITGLAFHGGLRGLRPLTHPTVKPLYSAPSQRGAKPMRFGVFYELQLPKPWGDGDEHRLFKDALAQMVLAARPGYDYAWAVEHHFLD